KAVIQCAWALLSAIGDGSFSTKALFERRARQIALNGLGVRSLHTLLAGVGAPVCSALALDAVAAK
ncbi:unnamed protein product, partial [Prorocentrum cordatum]